MKGKAWKWILAVLALVGLAWVAWRFIARAMLRAEVAAGKRVNPNAQKELASGQLGPIADLMARYSLSSGEAQQVMAGYALGHVDGSQEDMFAVLDAYVKEYGSLRKTDGSIGYGAG